MVHALRGKEHVEWDNPYDVGMTGLIGFSSGYYAMLDCDILLMLGTDFPYRQFYPRGSGVRIAHVDIRPENIGKRTPVDLGVVGDVKATIIALLPLLKEKSDDSHLAQARKHYAKARKSLDDWRSERANGCCTRNRSPKPSVITPQPTLSSPAMSACRRCGRRDIWR